MAQLFDHLQLEREASHELQRAIVQTIGKPLGARRSALALGARGSGLQPQDHLSPTERGGDLRRQGASEIKIILDRALGELTEACLAMPRSSPSPAQSTALQKVEILQEGRRIASILFQNGKAIVVGG
jgi:hypothetical protein